MSFKSFIFCSKNTYLSHRCHKKMSSLLDVYMTCLCRKNTWYELLFVCTCSIWMSKGNYLNLSTAKVIGLCHQYKLIRLYTVGWPTTSSYLDIPKMIMDRSKYVWWIIPFKNFDMVRVNNSRMKTWSQSNWQI